MYKLSDSHGSQRKVWNGKATVQEMETKANSVQKTHRQDQKQGVLSTVDQIKSISFRVKFRRLTGANKTGLH